jgi:hypothetical protein
MLFLAVFLGFIAENIRENTVENKRGRRVYPFLCGRSQKRHSAVHLSFV